MKFEKKYIMILAAVFFWGAFSSALLPKISIAGGVNVKILYDFSGSMYPGYPTHRIHESGVRYFHQYPHFRRWLADFATSQTRFNAKRISMSTFRSRGPFRAGDITKVHPPVPVNRFNVNRALSRPRESGLDYTHLTESLNYFTRDHFEGLVWLITDNRVETGTGSTSTRDFFISLRNTPKYRSIHIYKLPFRDMETGQQAAIAIYGILVSPTPLKPGVSRWYDEQFLGFREKFEERRHLKLKDLSVAPIQITIAPIEVDIASPKKNITEGGVIELCLNGTVKSNLTQHTITGGRLKIEALGDFNPDPFSKKQYHIKKIPGKNFGKVRLDISGDIPPNGKIKLKTFCIKSKQPVSLSVSGFVNQIKAAVSGVRVTFSGEGVVSSDRLDVAIKREGRNRITGIYGSGDIDSIFGSQSALTQIKANPAPFDITFILKTGAGRSFMFLLILLLVVVFFVLLIFFMRRKEIYRIKKGQSEEHVRLYRLGSHRVMQDGILLGVLKRGIGQVDSFSTNTGLAGLKINAGKKEGEYRVNINNKNENKTFNLNIQPLNMSRSIREKVAPAYQMDITSVVRSGKSKGGHSSPSLTPQDGRTKRKMNIRRPR